VAAPVLGFLSVGVASAAAGQASAALTRWRRDGHAWDSARWKSFVQVDDLVLDALMGAALFAVRGVRAGAAPARRQRHAADMRVCSRDHL
jgi:hypothetical protein